MGPLLSCSLTLKAARAQAADLHQVRQKLLYGDARYYMVFLDFDRKLSCYTNADNISQMLALQAREYILTCVCEEFSMRMISVWAKSSGQYRKHTQKQIVITAHQGIFLTTARNVGTSEWQKSIVTRLETGELPTELAEPSSSKGWGGRSSLRSFFQLSRGLCIQLAALVIYKSFV